MRAPGNRRMPTHIMDTAIALLKENLWSPEQISTYLKQQYGVLASHETIYAYIRKDKMNGGELFKLCRHALKHRKHHICGSVSKIPDRVSISERPIEADGQRFGDFEIDTIVGKGNKGAIVTLIERKTNMLFARKLPKGKDALALAKTVVKMLWNFKGHIKTITTDNGCEFASHKFISQALGCDVFFADPYASWQKGAIENANGLLRQYIPKKMNFDCVSQNDVKRAVRKINSRPRKKIGYNLPCNLFFDYINKNCTC